MNKEATKWFEELPEQCPPEDAIEWNLLSYSKWESGYIGGFLFAKEIAT